MLSSASRNWGRDLQPISGIPINIRSPKKIIAHHKRIWAKLTLLFILLGWFRLRQVTDIGIDGYFRFAFALKSSAAPEDVGHIDIGLTKNDLRQDRLAERKDFDAQFADEVVIIVKTGASVMEKRLPLVMDTFAGPIKNLILVSDLAATFRDRMVHDVLERISKNQKVCHSDPMIAYFAQQSGQQAQAQESWRMDAFKPIPALRLAWKLYPHKRWYMLIDDDSYLYWRNLLHVLQKLDHNKAYLLCGLAGFGDSKFCYGGAGTILSERAMYAANVEELDRFVAWETRPMHQAFGDVILTRALEDIGLNISTAESEDLFEAENPSDLLLDSRDYDTPLLTHHHMKGDDYSQLSSLEQLYHRRPLITKLDVFESLTAKRNVFSAVDWDYTYNWDMRGPGKDGSVARDWQDCRRQCADFDTCLAWCFNTSNHYCTVVNILTPGTARQDCRSGIMRERIHNLRTLAR